MNNISYDQAIELINLNNVILLDVQKERDYAKKHLLGSINIPVEEIKEKIKTMKIDKNQIIVVYCLKGIRSEAAVDVLKRLGYSNLYNIQGGIEG